MQDVSYWLDGTARTKVTPGVTSMEVTEATRLARKYVQQEIRSKGFKLRSLGSGNQRGRQSSLGRASGSDDRTS